MLPEGTKVADAAAGFNHLGQFISAVHVSHKLGLPLDALRQEILSGSSLGQAIQELKPDMPKQKVMREMRRAQVQAKEEMNLHGMTEWTRNRNRERSRTEQGKQP
jgi:hypothetical protein